MRNNLEIGVQGANSDITMYIVTLESSKSVKKLGLVTLGKKTILKTQFRRTLNLTDSNEFLPKDGRGKVCASFYLILILKKQSLVQIPKHKWVQVQTKTTRG